MGKSIKMLHNENERVKNTKKSTTTKKAKKNSKTDAKYIPTKIHQQQQPLDNLNDNCVDNNIRKDLNQLLAYTYFLDSNEKQISIGYDANTLLPTINITHFPSSTIEIIHADWMTLCQHSQNITDLLSSLDMSFKIDLNGALSSRYESSFIKGECISISIFKHIDQNNNCIVIQNLFDNSSFIKLYINEWKKMSSLFNFINSVLNWYILSTSNIKHFYQQYVKNCAIQNVSTLDKYFDVEDNLQITFNRSRLFFELPIVCSGKLAYDISLYKLFNDTTTTTTT